MKDVRSSRDPSRGAPRRALRNSRRVIKFIWRHPANRGRRIRSLARGVLFQVAARILRRPIPVRLGARSRILARLHDHASVEVVYANPPDLPEMLVWGRLKPGDLFIDIGAHIGTYSILAAERGTRVISVEPDPSAAARLRENVALNGYPIEVVEAAVTDSPGVAYLSEGLEERNHLLRSPQGKESRAVRTVTLDELLGDQVAAGVKVDVEGAEALVLAGGSRALSEGRLGVLQLEWNKTSFELLGEDRTRVRDLLLAAGYTLFRPTQTGHLIPVEDIPLGRPDVFAIRAAKELT